MKTIDKILYFALGAALAMVFSILVALDAQAADWVCHEQASMVRDTSILACGIGLALTESDAREKALAKAMEEFQSICKVSDNCAGHEVNVVPKRTECQATETGFMCYRAVEFEIKSPETKIDRDLAYYSMPESRRTFAAGVFMGTTENQDVEVGYTASLKYRLFSGVHFVVGGTLGKVEYVTYEGSYANGFAGFNVYVNDRVYLLALAGLERRWGNPAQPVARQFVNVGLGADVIKVRSVNITLEGSVKAFNVGGVQPVGGIGFSFKF